MTNLLEDDNYFDAHFNTTPQALELQNALELRLKGNIELARMFLLRFSLSFYRPFTFNSSRSS